MKFGTGYDWQEVVAEEPKGDMELQDPQRRLVIRGPIESIKIDDKDFVVITLRWAAQMGTPGTPGFGTWSKVADDDRIFRFPNLMVPFEIEEPNSEKGPRVRFGFNLIYFRPGRGSALDPSKIPGLEGVTP